jgi:hypothetical protein
LELEVGAYSVAYQTILSPSFLKEGGEVEGKMTSILDKTGKEINKMRVFININPIYF